MHVTYTTIDGRMTFAFDAQGVKGVFAGLAQVQEVFEHNTCGQCESTETVLDLREHDGNSYYKKRCLSCGAQLDFGQHKTGDTLFAKRRDKDHGEIGRNGWYHWERKEHGSSQAYSGEESQVDGITPF